MYQIDGINDAELNNTRLFTAYKRSGVRNDDLLHYGVGHNDNPPR